MVFGSNIEICFHSEKENFTEQNKNATSWRVRRHSDNFLTQSIFEKETQKQFIIACSRTF